MLGDHNLMAKMNFYRSSVLVPAIIRPPEPMSPRVEDGIIESIDLTRTILDVAGAEPIEDSKGMSLLPFLEGRGSGKEVAYSAIESRGDDNPYFFMAATDRYRLTIERNTGTACELFDLQEDPDELNNLVNDPQYGDLCEELKKTYLEPHLAVPPF
jgi:arylsulfatase A-like enzyme